MAQTDFRKLGTWIEDRVSRYLIFQAVTRCLGDGGARLELRASCNLSHVEEAKMAAAQAVEEMRSRVVLGEFGVRNVSFEALESGGKI